MSMPPNVSRMVEDIVGCKWSLAVLGAVRGGVCRPGALEHAIEMAGVLRTRQVAPAISMACSDCPVRSVTDRRAFFRVAAGTDASGSSNSRRPSCQQRSNSTGGAFLTGAASRWRSASMTPATALIDAASSESLAKRFGKKRVMRALSSCRSQ
jgi:hypothetical protein